MFERYFRTTKGQKCWVRRTLIGPEQESVFCLCPDRDGELVPLFGTVPPEIVFVKTNSLICKL
jgi:hypothetical protein